MTRREGVVLLALTLLAALIRLPFLSRFGLWLDEIYVREAAIEPLAANLRTVHFIHFLAVKAGLALSDSDFGLRLASALFGITGVPLGYLVVRRPSGPRVAAIFAACLAFVPYFINYSIDANYYSHMIFWSLLGLAAAVRFAEGGSPIWLAIQVPLALAGFFVHPFSAIFFGSLILVGVTGLTRRWLRRERGRAPDVSPGLALALPITALVLLLGVVWVLSATASGRELQRVAGRFADMIELGRSPTNVDFTWGFFENYFRRIGPAYYAVEGGSAWLQALVSAGSLLCFAAFLGGLARLRRRRVLVAILLLPFLLSFAVLFNLRAERHFNLRYFSYLVPLYWLGIALAVEGAGNVLARRLGSPAGRAIPLALLLALLVPQYAHLLRTDGRNWDAVIPVVASRARPDEPLVFTNWAEEAMLPFYQERYGLESQPTHRLAYTPRRERLAESELKDLCYRTASLWFISSWLDIHSDEAVEWASTRMDTVARGRSVFSERYDVTAYHWNHGGRFVLPPRILDYRPGRADLEGGRFGQAFLFDASLTYRIEIHMDPGARADPILEIDGQRQEILRAGEPEEEPNVWIAELPVGAGERRLAVTGPEPSALKFIRIAPVYPEATIPISAVEASSFYPSDFVWTAQLDGSAWIGLKRNTFAAYDFGVLRSGDYELGCVARHDRPGPVWIELRLDGRVAGILEFAANSNAPDIRRLPVRLPAGAHRLTARFLNEGDVGELPEDLDRDAWIRAFSLRALKAGEVPRDDRLFVPGPSPRAVPLADAAGGAPSGAWSLIADGDLHPRIVAADLPEGVAWTAEVPRASRGLLLRSAPLPLAARNWAYLSAQLRAENLMNHSINLRVTWLDKMGEPLGETVVNQEGIYRSTDWIRFVAFHRVPDVVGAAQLALWAYPNGRQPSPDSGRVFFGDVRIEAGAPAAAYAAATFQGQPQP